MPRLIGVFAGCTGPFVGFVVCLLKYCINLFEQPKCHLTTVGLSLARVTCETSEVLLAGGQVFFLGDLPFLPHLTIYLAQNE